MIGTYIYILRAPAAPETQGPLFVFSVVVPVILSLPIG
jgi:hypothetical protein